MMYLYILGAGRTGTTLLGIALSNNSELFDAGEILKFIDLNGKPHGVEKESMNYKFWEKIKIEFYNKFNNNVESKELTKIINRVEGHFFFLFNYFNIIRKRTLFIYQSYINTLINIIFKQSGREIIIDSSKYPGRALALKKYLDKSISIKYIYIKRKPVDVVKSFSKTGIEQPKKNFWAANLYYFIINFFCHLFLKKIDKNNYITVKYEDFINQPDSVLLSIQNKFNIDLSNSIDLIKNRKELFTGYIFEGNRIRLKKSIKIVKIKKNHDSVGIKDLITNILNGFWYR